MAKRRVLANDTSADPPRIALIDANVFFAPRLRDLFMLLHAHEFINVHWTKEIESEWTRNVVARQEGVNSDAIQACLRGMRDAVPGWEVTGHAKHMSRFERVDAKDRHVAAAAYKLSLEDWPGQRVALVTSNLKDFPLSAFDGTAVTPHAPGVYIDALYGQEQDHLLQVAQQCRRKLKHPPMDRQHYVEMLMSHRCDNFAKALAAEWKVACPKRARNGTLHD